jgi:hypothetical protein
MKRLSLRFFALLILSGGAVGAGAMVAGCGGIDCADTATCLETTDGQPPEDHSVDVAADAETGAPDSGDASLDGDATIADGDAGHDAAPDAPDGADASDADAADASDGDAHANPDSSDGCVAAAHEDCTNGKDDTCNGLVDCADPDCTQNQGFACVPAWPTGWDAPVAYFTGTAPPPCPAAFFSSDVADGHTTPTPLPAQCDCACGTSQGTSCTTPFVGLFTGSNTCSGAAPFAGSVNATCGPLAPQGGINSAQMIDAGVPSGGTCAPQTTVTRPTWDPANDWATTERVCALAPAAQHTYVPAPQNGCATGQYCAEPPPSTFNGGKVCIYQIGQPSCPAGYSTKTTFFDGGTENRSCSGSCSCGSPSGAKCNTRINLVSGTCASGTNPQFLNDTSCLPLTNYGTGAVSASMTQSITGGTCAPASTLVADGGIIPTGPATVCCPP